MEPIGYFFASILALGLVGVVAVMVVGHLHKKDSDMSRRMNPECGGRETYEP